MKLTDNQRWLLGYINGGALRPLGNGDYYYSVPTDTRRSGKMLVKKETIPKFKKLGLITIDI